MQGLYKPRHAGGMQLGRVFTPQNKHIEALTRLKWQKVAESCQEKNLLHEKCVINN